MAKKPGEALGGWGYVFVLLGAGGFIVSALFAPALLFAVPYCDRCQQYKKTKALIMFPASVPLKKIAKGDTAAQQAHDQEQAQAAAQADETLSRLRTVINEGIPQQYKKELDAIEACKRFQALQRRVRLSLTWCKGCKDGKITETLINHEGAQIQEVVLAEHPVPAAFVTALLE